MNFLGDGPQPPSAGEAAGQEHSPSSLSEIVGFTSGKESKGQKHKLPSIDFSLNIREEKIGR